MRSKPYTALKRLIPSPHGRSALLILAAATMMTACAAGEPSRPSPTARMTPISASSRSAVPTLSLEQPLERLLFQEIQRLDASADRAQAYIKLATVMFKRHEFSLVQRTLRYASWELRDAPELVVQLEATLAALTKARGKQRLFDALSCGQPQWCRRLDALDETLDASKGLGAIYEALVPSPQARLAQLEAAPDQATRDALIAQWEAQLDVALKYEPQRLVRAQLERLRLLDQSATPPKVSAAQLERLATIAAQIKQRDRREAIWRALGYYGLSHDLGQWAWALSQEKLKQRSLENARFTLEAAIHTARWPEALTLATIPSPTASHLEPIERTIDALILSGQLELAARAIDAMPRVARWRAQLIRLAKAAHEAKDAQLVASQLELLAQAIKEEEQDLEPDQASPIAHGIELAQAYSVTGQRDSLTKQRWDRVEQQLTQALDVEDVISPWLDLLEVQRTSAPTRAARTAALLMQRLTSSRAVDISLDERALGALQGAQPLLGWAPQLIGAMWPLWDNTTAPQYIEWLVASWAGLDPAQQRALLKHHMESPRSPLEQDQLVIALLKPCAQAQCLETLMAHLSERELDQREAGSIIAQFLEAQAPLEVIIAAISSLQTTSKQQALVALLDARPQALKHLSGPAWALELQSARGVSARRLRRALIRAALTQADCELAIDLMTNSSLGPAGPFTWQEAKACLQTPAKPSWVSVMAPAIAKELPPQERVTLYLALLQHSPQLDEAKLVRALPEPSRR